VQRLTNSYSFLTFIADKSMTNEIIIEG
jgi:hypothetical protein